MKENRRRHAFTLIEMLVVILIIGILAGVVFKMMQYANRDALKAETVFVLEAVANALNEFRSEYGTYPPTRKVAYVYEDVNRQTRFMREDYVPNNAGADLKLFDYGLVAYLWPRDREGIEHTAYQGYDGDTERDRIAKQRWAPLLAEVPLWRDVESNRADQVTGQQTPYVNKLETILDGWDREIMYESTPPFLTYKLWSRGADGVANTDDDIHREKWDN